jgi:hypothetical protein
MSNKYNQNLFDSLKEALASKTNNDSSFKDFMKFEPDKSYLVRLLPNLEDGSKTRFHYYQHIFDSVATGKKVSVLCPNTYGEKCPIDEYRAKMWATKNQTMIDSVKPLKKAEKWLYNIYVIKDPTNPSNEGQVKIMNAGAQLQKVIQAAIDGDDAEEFGFRIFDLSENGCNLRVKVEKNDGGYPSYTSSKFVSPSKIEGLDDVDSVYSSIKSLDTIFQRKSYDEIKEILNYHFFGKDAEEKAPKEVSNEDFEVETNVSSAPQNTSSDDQSNDEEVLSEQEKKMQEILKNL